MTVWTVHTLVLDVDDTLFPEREFVLGGFTAVGNWLRERQGIDGFTPCAVRLFEAGKRGKIFDDAWAQLGFAENRELIAQLVAVYRAHQPKLSLFSDARELLAWAVGRLNVALVTDGFEAVQRAKLAALQLDPRIELRVVTDAMGGRAFWKPNPAPFRVVMDRYPGPEAGYLYVGDNPRKDFIAPRTLGWRTVRIWRPGGEHTDYVAAPSEKAEITVTNLAELIPLLASSAQAEVHP